MYMHNKDRKLYCVESTNMRHRAKFSQQIYITCPAQDFLKFRTDNT